MKTDKLLEKQLRINKVHILKIISQKLADPNYENYLLKII